MTNPYRETEQVEPYPCEHLQVVPLHFRNIDYSKCYERNRTFLVVADQCPDCEEWVEVWVRP